MTRVREGPGAPPKTTCFPGNAERLPDPPPREQCPLDFGFWLVACGFWLLAFSFWLLASSVWRQAFGFWLLASALCCYTLLYAALRCFTLLFAALRCSALLYAAIHSYTLLYDIDALRVLYSTRNVSTYSFVVRMVKVCCQDEHAQAFGIIGARQVGVASSSSHAM